MNIESLTFPFSLLSISKTLTDFKQLRYLILEFLFFKLNFIKIEKLNKSKILNIRNSLTFKIKLN